MDNPETTGIERGDITGDTFETVLLMALTGMIATVVMVFGFSSDNLIVLFICAFISAFLVVFPLIYQTHKIAYEYINKYEAHNR